MARSLKTSQAGAAGSGIEKSLAAALSASPKLRLPDELAARAQRQTKICMPQVGGSCIESSSGSGSADTVRIGQSGTSGAEAITAARGHP